MTLPVRGWKAIVIIIIACAWGYRQQQMRSTLDTQATELIKPCIVSHYMSKTFHETKNLPLEKLSQAEQDAYVLKIQASGDVQIKSIQTHGFGEYVIACVEFTVGGQTPPDGKRYRYYRLRHSILSGWIYDNERPSPTGQPFGKRT